MILLEGVMPSNDLLNGYWIPNRTMVILRTITLDEFLDFFDWQVDVVFEFLDMLRILDSRITQVDRFTKELFFEERNLISVDVVITDSQNQLYCLMVGDLCDQVCECCVLCDIKGLSDWCVVRLIYSSTVVTC